MYLEIGGVPRHQGFLIKALRYAKQPKLRRPMQKVLRDEKPHPSLQTLLEWFQEDEEGQVKNHEKSVAKKDIHSSTLTERRALRTIGTFIAVSMLDDNEKAASLDFG